MKNYQIFLINNSTRAMSHFEDYSGDINGLKDRLSELQKENYCATNEKPNLRIKTVETEHLFLQIMFVHSTALFSFFAIL